MATDKPRTTGAGSFGLSEEAVRAQMASTGGGTSTGPRNPFSVTEDFPVFISWETNRKADTGRRSQVGGTRLRQLGKDVDEGPPARVPKTRLASQILTDLRRQLIQNPTRFVALGDQLVEWGYLEPGYSIDDVLEEYSKAVGRAGMHYNDGEKITLDEVLALYAPNGGALGTSALSGKGKGGTYTSTSTTSDVDTQRTISSETDIEAATRPAAQERIGRYLKAGEVGRYVGAVQGAQRANPTTTRRSGSTTNTQTADAEGRITASSSTGTSDAETTGGVNEDLIIENMLMGEQEYGAFQAAGVYWPALMAALGAIE